METLDLEHAARFLKLHPEELRRRAKAGEKRREQGISANRSGRKGHGFSS